MPWFQLLAESRKVTYTIVLGIWGLVALYAILHDQYIVRIAPEHFTVFHEPLWGISNPRWLAVAYAFKASFAPGLILGMACAFAARHGSWPQSGYRIIFTGSIIVIGCTELVSAISGLMAYWWEEPLYPVAWYPDLSLPMVVTNTIQLTCYLSSALFSGAFIVFMIWSRFRADRIRRSARIVTT